MAAYAAIMILFALTALTVTFLQTGISFTRTVQSRLDDERAMLLAEAAVAESVLAMRDGGTGRVGREDTPATFGDGLFWVDIEDVSTVLRRLRATAMVGSGRTSLEVLVFHDPPTFITSALFSNQSLAIGSTTMLDSFDSALGPYDAQLAAAGGDHLGTGAVLQSNGDVKLGSAVDIWGHIHPGPNGVVSIPNSSQVDGSLQPSSTYRKLTPVSVPPIPISGPQVVAGPAVFPAGDYGWSVFEVTSGTVIVEGPARLVLGDWEVQSGTELVFDTSAGPVEMYVSGDTELDSNARIATTQATARDLALFFVGGPGQDIELHSNSEFYGTIYAPEGEVEISANFEVYGAIAADSLDIAANVAIHFDEALIGVALGAEEFVVSSWAIVGLPDKRYRLDRTDPFDLLGVDAAALPAPAAAHDLP